MRDWTRIKWLIRKHLPVILEVLVTALCLYQIWYYGLPKFHDLTVELGTETVRLGDFATEHAKPGKLGFVSDPALVDLSRVGTTEIRLSHGVQKETVTLTVADTLAPEVTFAETYVQRIDTAPLAENFVTDISDMSETTVYFDSDVVMPKDYSDVMVTVVAEDAWGNKVQSDCVMKWLWLQESYALEYGETLTREDILLDPARDASLISQKEIDAINAGEPGTYTITGQVGGQTATCQVTVADTRGPELVLRNVRVYRGAFLDLNAFVESAADISGIKEIRLLSELDTINYGEKTVIIEAEDYCGNVTTGEAILWVASEGIPPVISGANTTLKVKKYSNLNLLEGVSATDNQDGICQVTCDTGALNMNIAGTYTITYNAWDHSGNRAMVNRYVIVEHDEADTAALAASIAAELSDDPEEIRDYVRRHIGYNHDWGDNDPVWYGFTKRVGNCYVHAMCLKSIFDLKGIESQLIWVTAKSHYWLIVNIDGTWKHIDATPGRLHSQYSLMNDQQRLATLSGRVWDTTLWPACE